MMMSDLPRDLLEEILSRTPLTSTRAVRSTCKNWNTLSKDDNFRKKQLGQAAKEREREGEFLAIVVINLGLYLVSVNPHRRIQNNSIKPEGKLFSLEDSDKVKICRVCHCEGLLLCTTVDYTRLIVWNPYTGQTRWISVEPRGVLPYYLKWYGHALGYDKSQSHKILRFLHWPTPVHEIYELNSNLWRILDVTPDWNIDYDCYGLSLKGNTYWFAYDKEDQESIPDFLICFDFETERFGPRLDLPPLESYIKYIWTLSSVRGEQLATLFQCRDTFEMEIWVTTKIEPNAVLWSNLFKVYIQPPLAGFRFYNGGSFLIDEERRAVVGFEIDYTSYIIGENGYYREVELREIATTSKAENFSLACSYVPSSVQINQPVLDLSTLSPKLQHILI